MDIRLANHSSYPQPPQGPDLPHVLREQANAGLDLITDGQLTWEDAITPLLSGLHGVRLGEPVTLPELGATFRRPLIQAKLRRYQPLALDAYRRAAAAAPRPLKVVLTGPYTLARAAEIGTTAYRGATDLAVELSTILAQEVGALADAGAKALQIDEPLALVPPHDMRLLRELLEPIYDAAAPRIQMFVATYGRDAAELYAQLNSLPADVIAVDCADRATMAEAIAETGSGKALALGVVNGATAHLEPPGAVADLCRHLLRRYIHPTIWLQPSCGLRGLSAAQARAKLDLLTQARAALSA